jgi:4-hydroxy-2-oxoheptanedioate aldolase
MRANRIQHKLASGQTAWLGWSSIDSAYAAELMGHAGFDAVLVDLQHGPFHLESATAMMQALSATPATPVARCPSLDAGTINKLLDAGAWGIVCPMIDTAQQAQALVSACRYPPQGTRSFGPARGFLYGGADYFEHANQTIQCWAMIETREGLDNLDSICATEGLDGVFVGPSDLSLALGQTPVPRWHEAPLADALQSIIARAKATGIGAGIFCGSIQMAIDMRRLGYQLIVPGFDAQYLGSTARDWLAAARED